MGTQILCWHIHPHENGWKIERADNHGATAIAATEEYARNLADRTAKLNLPAHIQLHDSEGSVREEWTLLESETDSAESK